MARTGFAIRRTFRSPPQSQAAWATASSIEKPPGTRRDNALKTLRRPER
jgi:hypothetical protein